MSMANSQILTIYIKKLNHPLKEIRERALQLLTAKLKLGWELDDELSSTRQLLEALLAWFHAPEPTLQNEALRLFLSTIKTKAGSYITKEFGITTILSNLNNVKHKIAGDALEVFDDIIDTLRFVNTVESDCNVAVPRLQLPDLTSSESDGGSSSGYYNLGQHFQYSKETSLCKDSDTSSQQNGNTSNSIRILLFPWVEMYQSDKKTLLLVEDSLKLLRSTRRCCRFIRDVFLRDFPPEIFLNRPEIVKSLLAIADGNHGGKPGEALLVLLYITRALRTRILQLSSLDLIHEASKLPEEHKEMDDGVNLELEEIVGGTATQTVEEDGLATLRQWPAPIYALDTMHAILSIMARSVVLVDPVDKTELLEKKDLNTCLCLIDSLVGLLLDCIDPGFWNMDHSYKTYRDISHKSCMTMRLLGDLLDKYRNSFFDDPDRYHHRVAWLRLVMFAERLLNWAKDSALPPSSLITAMQLAQLDPAIEMFYPELSKNIELVLQNTRTAVNQEYKSKYRELKKLFASMDEAMDFLKNKKNNHTKSILSCIKNSLLVLELFHNDNFLHDIANIIFWKTKDLDLSDSEWSTARSIALSLMAHNLEWVQATFYKSMADMVKSILVGDDNYLSENEKCLTLLCDVGMLTEICCHGLSSKMKEVEEYASDIMLYLLRGRLILSESYWWRLLASLLPVLPLLHVYAAHETPLGKAICKSLERDIAECMGVSTVEVTNGLVRLMFVKCVAVQLDAAHTLCRWLDDDQYLPPKEALRADILLSALRRVQPQEFNVDLSSSPSKTLQTGGLMQILDVLKQDIMVDEDGEYIARRSSKLTLEPSLRRSTLQQLALIMRQQDLHDTFLQCDGVKLIVSILRMSLRVDDYLAFPECAISCVSVLNSVCFVDRHNMFKISDLSSLLIRAILVFPANDPTVLMASQILALVSWAGFALHELDASRQRIPALPLSVTQRTTLPFNVHSYWKTSANAEHSYIEWLLAEEEWRVAIRVRWWRVYVGRARVLSQAPPPAPLALSATPRDMCALRTACPVYSCTTALLELQNATSHRHVIDALHTLGSYVYLVSSSNVCKKDFSSLPWHHTKRFLCSPPASSRDTTLLCLLLQFVISYMDNVPDTDGTMSWIKSTFIGNDANIISLLSRDEFYPQQTMQDKIEVTQLHIHIVKVLVRCIIKLEQGDYHTQRLESLIKILMACLEKLDPKNFHMLGYLNELMRCIRYALNSRYCKLSEETLIQSLKLITKTLCACSSGTGCKGNACRLDATLCLLALMKQIHEEGVPVQRWNECFDCDVVSVIMRSVSGSRAELRAAALHVIVDLAYYPQMQPQLLQAIEESSLSEFATQIFCHRSEANAVRAAAACLLTAIASRASSRSDVLETDVLEQLKENHFVENCLEILIDFCNTKEYIQFFEPNVPVSLLERRNELEVRAQKGGDVYIPISNGFTDQPPPSAELVISLSDALHNICAFKKCPLQQWNEQGLFRLLFRCCSWSCPDSMMDNHRIRAAACGALLVATSYECIRSSLAATKDCLHNLLMTLTPFSEADREEESVTSRARSLSLLASLVGERAAAENVWGLLVDMKEHSGDLFHLLLQCLDSEETELQDAAIFCLTELTQSMTQKRNININQDEPWSEAYDVIKSPYRDEVVNDRGGGDSARSVDCRPEYMAEELCKSLIMLYQKLSENKKYDYSEESRWSRVCACMSRTLASSARSRTYATHRGLTRLLVTQLAAVRDVLTLQGKPADVIRNANNNPVLSSLYWLLTIIDCSMVECFVAKESYAEENIALYLCRLWPWCMMTEQLRFAIVHLIYTFTNDCSKGVGACSSCVCGRTLAGELCALVSRDATRTPPPPQLLLALHTLRRLVSHHHCRAILLKSDALVSVYRACLRCKSRGAGAGAVGAAWARLCEAAARHAEGAWALLGMRAGAQLPTQLPSSTRTLLLPAIAHAAHHHRLTFLQSPDLLELLSDTLLAGDTAEIVSAARAVWALAANNHKAKLVLRSAGAATAVNTTLLRLQRLNSDGDIQKAVQLLIYTNTVLQTS